MLFRLKAICNRGFCTCFPDTLFGFYIGKCCKPHDDAYEKQDKSKEIADETLGRCVVREMLYKWYGYVVATVMWLGVRIGGYTTSWNAIKKER